MLHRQAILGDDCSQSCELLGVDPMGPIVAGHFFVMFGRAFNETARGEFNGGEPLCTKSFFPVGNALPIIHSAMVRKVCTLRKFCGVACLTAHRGPESFLSWYEFLIIHTVTHGL